MNGITRGNCVLIEPHLKGNEENGVENGERDSR